MAQASYRTRLIALMGSAAAATALVTGISTHEGKENVGYLDIAKIPTACYGDTQDVVVGKFYNDAECQVRLERQALTHVEGVVKCVPGLKGRGGILRGVGSTAYNIGIGGFCGSTAAARFKAGDWIGGCLAIGPYFVVQRKDGSSVVTSGFINARISGKLQPVQGLINRRVWEMDQCIRGIA
ncbi:glycoside hydrolase family protein [uncultured Sphingobium sp.]|uniref:glycoside hydrolase family protein n=1 Tax=uncultured Sphingobium sp. TaxID=316087 RepID=UPI00259BDFD7|nr:glycoside hydrolase family protein [uncultured Sphingobium sp.]